MINIITTSKLDEKILSDVLKIEEDCFSNPYNKEQLTLDSRAKYFVIYNDNTCLGYAYISGDELENELYRIAIYKKYQRQGYGKLLLLKALSSLRNGTKIFLEVKSDNVAAKTLYEKCGFETYNIRYKYYSDGEDAILMEKVIE